MTGSLGEGYFRRLELRSEPPATGPREPKSPKVPARVLARVPVKMGLLGGLLGTVLGGRLGRRRLSVHRVSFWKGVLRDSTLP